MADNTLRIILQTIAKGKGAEIATKGLERVEKVAKKAGARLGEDLVKAGKVGALALAGFGLASIKFASDVEEAASKFSEVFGPAAEETGKRLDEFAEIANRSRFEMREMAADVGSLLEPMLGSKDAAADMSVNLVKLATDLGSFNNVAESDVLIALRAGLIGSSEPMLAFGVDTREAAVQAEIFTSGIAELGDTVSQEMKIQARYNIIMRQTKTAQGDAERTSDSFANTLKGFEASVGDLMATVGKTLIPIAKDVVKFLGEVFEELDRVFNAAGRFREGISEAASEGKRATQTYEEYSAAVRKHTDELAENLGGANLYIDAQGNLIRVIGEGIFATERLFEANALLTESEFAAVQAGALLEDSDRKLAIARSGLKTETENLVPTLDDLKQAEGRLKAEEVAATEAAKAQSAAAREQAASLEAARGRAADTAIEFDNLAQSLIDATNADLAKVALDNLGTSLQEGAITQGEYQAATRDVMLTFGLATEESLLMADSLGDVNQLYEDGKISADEYTDILGTLNETGGSLDQALGLLDITMGGINEVQGEAELSALALNTAHGDAVPIVEDLTSKSEDLTDQYSDLKDREHDVALAAELVADGVEATIGPVTASGAAARAAATDWVALLNAMQGVANAGGLPAAGGGASSPVSQFQHGGDIGRFGIVGEAGPELVVGNRVFSTPDTERMISIMERLLEAFSGAGNTTNQIFNFPAGTSQATAGAHTRALIGGGRR